MTLAPDSLRLEEAGVRLDSMPPQGRDLHLSVGEEERAALAQLLQITAVERLEVWLKAVKFRGGMRVTGRLQAAIVQPSVVTLEPVEQEIEEPIDRIFLPAGGRSHLAASGTEVFVDPEAEDAPDFFDGPEADMSALIIEVLALAIDPYPRAEGESVEDLGIPKADVDESPFAGLKSLTKPDDKG